MDNQDKIFEKIKNASLNQEAQDFASMDKVWQRVENKLDNKVLKKENNLWKKIAIASSVLLLLTIGYQFLKPQKAIVVPENNVVVTQPEVIVPTEKTAPSQIIRKDAEKILWQQLHKKTAVAVQDKAAVEEESPMMATPAVGSVASAKEEAVNDESLVANESEADKEIMKDKKSDGRQSNASSGFAKRNFNARSVSRQESKEADFGYEVREAKNVAAKSPPLVVVDGKAVTSKPDSADELKKSVLSNIDKDDLETIVILKEPLYIINGSHYTEQELFGPNPTSPYHPLNQQEIETLSILQGEKAIAAYGKKGEKGVVIISTKNGKPIKTPARKE